MGLTHVLDKGLPLVVLESLLDLAGPCVDILKLGWGTGYVARGVRAKVATARRAGVRVCLGGTLLEVAVAQRRVSRLVRWVADLGMDTVEVSGGAIGLEPEVRRRLIRDLSRDFLVLAEVGSKDPAEPVRAADWLAQAVDDLEAGAGYVIAEGRESGTVGLYEPDGSIREELVAFLLEELPADRLIFEAPRKSQQVWLVRRVGPDVNLGNIPPDEVLGVETLRLGLRADTAWLAVRSWSRSVVAQALFERSG
jgi:phosphosulfolactate synthase